MFLFTGSFEQHLYPLSTVESTNAPFMPRNINRYFSRTVDMDLLFSSTSILIYTKLPLFVLIGVVKSKESSKMRGSRVGLKRGKINTQSLYFPTGVMQYIASKAKSINEKYSQLSANQFQKINNSIYKNPEKVINSKSFGAFLDDYNMHVD